MIDTPRIVVGVGDVTDGVAPLVWAVAEARRRGAEVHAVRAWRDRNQIGAMTGYWRQTLADAAQQVVVDAFTTGLGGVPRDVTVRIAVREGWVADVLLAYADREGDLLVVGTSRYGWLWPLGEKTVHRCVQHATCPVMVVPRSSLARSAPVRKLMRDLRREIQEFEDSSR